jgi:hypothetical protein
MTLVLLRYKLFLCRIAAWRFSLPKAVRHMPYLYWKKHRHGISTITCDSAFLFSSTMDKDMLNQGVLVFQVLIRLWSGCNLSSIFEYTTLFPRALYPLLFPLAPPKEKLF